MANNKDFKVKNGIKPTAYHEAVGTVTSGSEGYYLSGASYDSVSFSVASQDSDSNSFYIKPDGTKFWIVGNTNNSIYEYTMSTAWDLSTASYASTSFSVGSQDTSPYGLSFKTDGTKMYMLGQINDTVYQYTLSTAWDISTASYDSISFSVASQETSPTNLFFKTDGTKIYIVGSIGNDVNEYNLSTAWDISTASYNQTASFTSEEATPLGATFNSDGTKMYIVGYTSDTVFEYDLSTAYDISTATYNSVSFDVSSQDVAPYVALWKSDGTKMYVIGGGNNTIYQYSTSLTTATLDLSTGSVFEITPTAPTQISLSNPAASGTVSSATLILHGDMTASYDLNNIVGTGDEINVEDQLSATSVTNLEGIFISTDGDKMYLADEQDDVIHQYAMSSPFMLSTATYEKSLDISSEGTFPTAIFFKPDGTKMYNANVVVGGSTDGQIFQYDLSTAWDIGTATYNSKKLDSSTQETYPWGFWFKTDGTSCYVMGQTTDDVFQYDLTTAWDLSTASYASKSIAETSMNHGIAFNGDGTKIFIGKYLTEYDLSTAWDISTATASGNTAQGSYRRYDGSATYTVANGGKFIYRPYTYRSEKGKAAQEEEQIITRLVWGEPYSITYDSSIKFQAGLAPTSPEVGKTDVITFVTTDGGTTYTATKVIDGAV
jgi:DNA-binding beta-propeller fold protein YncE